MLATCGTGDKAALGRLPDKGIAAGGQPVGQAAGRQPFQRGGDRAGKPGVPAAAVFLRAFFIAKPLFFHGCKQGRPAIVRRRLRRGCPPMNMSDPILPDRCR